MSEWCVEWVGSGNLRLLARYDMQLKLPQLITFNKWAEQMDQ